MKEKESKEKIRAKKPKWPEGKDDKNTKSQVEHNSTLPQATFSFRFHVERTVFSQ